MVGIGGSLGAMARFWLGGYIAERMGTKFPYGTFVINASGSFLIGLIVTILVERTHLHTHWRYQIPIGFIGAYTTFSTFEYETLRAIQDGQWMVGFLNVLLSVTVGFAMVWLGMALGKAAA